MNLGIFTGFRATKNEWVVIFVFGVERAGTTFMRAEQFQIHSWPPSRLYPKALLPSNPSWHLIFQSFAFCSFIYRYLIDLTHPSDLSATHPQSTSIVPEGLLSGKPRLHSEISAETSGIALEPKEIDGGGDQVGDGSEGGLEPPTKRARLSGAQRKQAAKERNAEKKKGMNKGRRFLRVHDEQEICWRIACGLACDSGDK